MIRWMSLVVLAVAPILLADEPQSEQDRPEKAQVATTKPADTQPAALPSPRVKLETTLGDIVLELNAEKAPITVRNFLHYADSGFYNGTVFHRVIRDFMIQGGGFTPEMEEKQEGLRPPIKNEWKNGLKNERGTIAMARTPVADSATAQFFINVVDNVAGGKHDLDTPRPQAGNAAYAVFGKVVEGMDVVDKIRDTKLIQHPKYPSPDAVTPEVPVVIKSAKLVGTYDLAAMDARIEAMEKEAREMEAKAREGQQKQLDDFLKKVEQETGKKAEKTASGLMYVILKEGDGPSPKPADTVEVHYTGTLLDGKKFDSSVDRGRPFSFSLKGGVIQGWLEGVALMKVGEKRKLIIPPDLAYGTRGRGQIPPNATLVFDIELLSIKTP
jgi:FKBP-type peptidyl-prolyl cis-trans isomerase